MLNIRNIILSVALVVILLLTVPLVTAKTEVASDPSSDPASVLNNQEQSASQNVALISSYRSPLDECSDVPLREAAGCRNAKQMPQASTSAAISSYLSAQSLRDILNGRYEHRCCGLPR